MDKKDKQLLSKQIAEIRDTIIGMKNTEKEQLLDVVQGLKAGMSDQSKNFAGIIKAFENGIVDNNLSRTKLEKILLAVADSTSANSGVILKILKENDALIKSSQDQVEQFKSDFESSLDTGSIQIDFNGSSDYGVILELLEGIKVVQDEIIDKYEDYNQQLDESIEKYDESLSSLANFHSELESLSKEYKKQKLFNDLTNLSFMESQGQLQEVMVMAGQYSDILSDVTIPMDGVTDALQEANKLRSNFGGDSFDLFDQTGLSFKDAFNGLSDRFEEEKVNVTRSMMGLKDDVFTRLLDLSGYRLEVDDSGLTELYKLTENGFSRISGAVESKIVDKVKRLADHFELIGELNAINLTKTEDLSIYEGRRLDLAKQLHQAHVLDGTIQEGLLSTNEELLNNLDKTVAAALKEVGMLSEKHKIMMAINSASMATVRMQEYAMKVRLEELQLLQKYRDVFQSVEGIGSNIQNIFSSTMGILPDWMQNLIGVDKIQSSLSTAFSSAFTAFQDSIITDGKSVFEALTVYGSELGSSLTAALSPVSMLAIGIAALGIVAYGLTARISDISSELKISRREAASLYDQMLLMESAAGNISVTQEKIIAIQQAAIADSGKLLNLQNQSAKEMVEFASLIENVYGVGSDVGYQLIDIFGELGADDRLANNLSASVLEAATLAKISPDIIAQDLIEGADEIATFFGGMPADAARAVVELRKLGGNIKDIGQLIDKTWNVESFMNDMYELAALSGGDIDLTGVFDAGINDDPLGVQTALNEAIGSLAEFNNMDSRVKKKLADTVGMSVSAIGNMLSINEANLKLTKEEQAALDSHLSTMGDISNMSKEQLESRAKEFAAADAMNMAFTRIKATLSRALLPVVEVFSDVLIGISPILDLIGLGFKIIGLLIKPFIPGLKLVGKLVQWIGSGIESVLGGFDSVIGKIEGVGGSLGSAGDILSLGLLAATLKLTGTWGSFFGLLRKGFMAPLNMAGSLIGKLGDITKVGLPGAGQKTEGSSVLNTVKDKFSSSKDKITSFFTNKNTSTTNTTSSVNTSSGGMDFGKMKERMQSGFSSVGTFLKESMKSLGNIVKDGLGFLKDVGTGLANAIMEPLKVIAKAGGEMIESLLGGIGKGLGKFSPKAMIGAAGLLVLSGALWVASKALQNFNDVEWSSVAKAGVALVGLAGVAMLMGSAVPQMLLGAMAIGILGAALIPAAYALNMFNDVEWSSLAKAGVALVGLAAAAAGLSFIAPLIFIGSAAIAALGASLVVFGAGVTLTAIGVDKLAGAGSKILDTLSQLKDVNPVQLIGIGTGLTFIAGGIMALTMAAAGGGIMALFAGDPISKIIALGAAAPAIALLASSFELLVSSLAELNALLSQLDLSKLTDLGSSINKMSLTLDPSSQVLETNKIENTKIVNHKSLTESSNSISSSQTPTQSSQLIADNKGVIPSIAEAAHEKTTRELESSSSETTYNSTEQMLLDPRILKVLKQLLDATHQYGAQPVPAVIGNGTQRELAKSIRRINNQ